MNPRFSIYIPSKDRADVATTPIVLDKLAIPYQLVVEESQADAYAERFGRDKILILDPQYQRDYDTCDDLGLTKSVGAGAARNFIWDHSIAQKATHHWVMDDNIRYFSRLHENRRVVVGDGTMFHAMETFMLTYDNIGMAGPHYKMFAPPREAHAPFIISRVYSCNLIRNDVPHRWRGRYNEDVILSLDMLKAGWATIQFFAFLQDKLWTQQMKGGNTEAFYAKEGTLPKSQMLIREHPDVARLVWRFGRWHHYVDYKPFRRSVRLIPSENPPDPVDYNLKLIEPSRKGRFTAFHNG